MEKLVTYIPIIEFSGNNLGGPGYIVQADETILNNKVKSHRDRSAKIRHMHFALYKTKIKLLEHFQKQSMIKNRDYYPYNCCKGSSRIKNLDR
ncbi:hypothetical protein H312_03409 [Anncaliia algerae PRA339]|uniref:Uncharacterized protein n=1 Tax=Anncaliia algerae PRA339 TaxID=1288291 RepID=A0A059EVZ5_9MICR|nr:hypothetical protein H312_03409 [Anncaliia algerae PRA339]